MPTISFNTHLPGYEVLAELGRGNTRVLKARHVATGDIVAIKQYAFAADAETLRRFERESDIMTQIDHPNVVRVREVELTASMPYVVMDYVEGGDLRSLLRQEGHLPTPTIIRLGLQLTEAFRAFHPLRVVHRDIKPENILYRRLASGELHFLLTDFGIAKFWSDDTARTRTGQSMMTCEYASPEQFDNPRQVDAATDYYALGIVLYECLTGRVPFVLHNETGLAQFMQQVLTAPLPAPVTPGGEPIPPSLETLVLSLLTRNPQERLRSADEMELLLEQSRLENLRASRLSQSAQANRTLAGPVSGAAAPATPDETVATGDDYAYDEAEAGTNKFMWWGIGGTVVAAGLAFGLYTRSVSSADKITTPADSGAAVFADSSSREPITEQAPDTSASAQPLEETTTEESVPAESVEASDSVSTGAAPSDSATTMPPDSTIE